MIVFTLAVKHLEVSLYFNLYLYLKFINIIIIIIIIGSDNRLPEL